MMTGATAQFLSDYARQRAAEGRDYRGEKLWSLPYLKRGPLARQWAVRARSYEAFICHLILPAPGRLRILDLGAGNGWLCHRLARQGHEAVALDIRDDDIDGLGAARQFLNETPGLFTCILASFDDLPLPAARFDIVLFNASLHYATDLPRVLSQARRVTKSGGTLAILDSPFYARDGDGDAMVAEKHALGKSRFGDRAQSLLSQKFIEYLTPEKLGAASPDLSWTCHPVRYPLWYEMRPLLARIKGARPPSRFDLWTAVAP
jgi:SAM-dependent methyltransferase